MATIGVRSPYFISGATGGKSYQIKVTIDGTLRYTIFKNLDGNASFEISELVRDYLDIVYSGTLSSTPETDYVAEVEVYLDVWSTANGTGTGDLVSTTVLDVDASEGYGYFTDGYNYDLPGSNALLLSSDTIWSPEDTAGAFYYKSSAGEITRMTYSTTDSSKTSPGGSFWTLNIKRFPCSKYDAIKLVFINRFGMPQELYFFNKTTEAVSSTKEQYKSSNIPVSGNYSVYEHQYKTFNKQGNLRYILNTGYVDESYNPYMQELMLSEQVWMHIDGIVVPITVNSSDVSFKTSLNDKLVNYTVEVQEANDLINSMR